MPDGQWTRDTLMWFYILSNALHCIALDRQKRTERHRNWYIMQHNPDLLNQKLAHQLLLPQRRFRQNDLVFLWLFVFELAIHMWQTDGWASKTHNVAYQWSCIKIQHLNQKCILWNEVSAPLLLYVLHLTLASWHFMSAAGSQHQAQPYHQCSSIVKLISLRQVLELVSNQTPVVSCCDQRPDENERHSLPPNYAELYQTSVMQ